MLASPQDVYYQLEDANPHSIVHIWASNMYTKINRLMRFYSFDEIIRSAPNAIRFIKSLIAYFDAHGVEKYELMTKRIHTLYRGIDRKLSLQHRYIERGFMSTSWEKAVAKRFATSGDKDGALLCFTAKDLPELAKFVIIDTSIAPHFHESEVLFLPGSIEQQPAKLACIQCKYSPAYDIIDIVRNTPMPKPTKMKGGAPFNMTTAIQEALGKSLIYYRVRHQQPVEIFDRLDIPTDLKKAYDVISFTKKKMEQRHEDAMEMIPEYVALREQVNDTKMRRMFGFELWPALYDPKTNEVLSTHCMIPDCLFYEMFDKKREKDVVKAIKQWGSVQLWFTCT